MSESNTVLCLMAHPDDAEILCGGTLALLRQSGWQVAIATMTPGQAGSVVLNAEEISKVRRTEGATAAAVIQADYHCVESEDIFILYDKPTIRNVIALFRKVQPSMVITASPSDYMFDHEITSHLAQTACMAATIPNIEIEGTVPVSRVPYLYYADAVQGLDRFGKRVESDWLVDISSVMDIKEKMLACHVTQREWLRKISNVDEFINMMKEFSAKNGRLINKDYAEGFRQHLGYSYPTGNLLKDALQELVFENK